MIWRTVFCFLNDQWRPLSHNFHVLWVNLYNLYNLYKSEYFSRVIFDKEKKNFIQGFSPWSILELSCRSFRTIFISSMLKRCVSFLVKTKQKEMFRSLKFLLGPNLFYKIVYGIPLFTYNLSSFPLCPFDSPNFYFE